MMRRSPERLAVVLASMLAATSTFLFRNGESRSRLDVSPKSFSGTGYVRHEGAELPVAVKHWNVPAALERKLPWASDLFTPPNVILDRKTKTYVLVQLHDVHLAEAQARRSPVPFRVQLVGYVGDADRYLGIFENLRTGEIVVAGEGSALMNREFVVGKIEVRRSAGESQHGPNRPSVATAVLHDTAREADIVLTDLKKVYANAAPEDGPSIMDDSPAVTDGRSIPPDSGAATMAPGLGIPAPPEPLQATTELPDLDTESSPEVSDTKPESA